MTPGTLGLISAALMLFISSSAGAQQTISSTAGRYSVDLPAGFGAVKEQQQPVQTQVGSVVMNMQLAQTDDGNNAVMTAYCDYPEVIFNSLTVNREAAINAMFDSARAGGLRTVQRSNLISETKIELHGLPGRSIVFSGLSQGKKIYGRFDYYIDVPRLYQIGYVTMDSASVESKPIRVMFSSFTVRPLSPTSPDVTDESDAKTDSGR